MKIAKIEVYRVRTSRETWLWLSISTEDGFIGWGEFSQSGNDEATAQVVQSLSSQLVGKDPRNLLDCTADYANWHFPPTRENRYVTTAWSGIDQALWDLRAQCFNLPLYQLLGGQADQPIALYANINRELNRNRGRSPEAHADCGQQALKQGFTFVKCAPFDEVTPTASLESINPGLERLEALVEKIPTDRLAIDCHQRFHRRTLAAFLSTFLEQGNPFWIEDPVASAKEFRCARERYPELQWAGGETTSGIPILVNQMQQQAYDVLMPDVKHCGGVSTLKTLIPLAEAMGRKISLHNPSGPISTAFSAHLTTLCRHPLPLEFGWEPTNERANCVSPAEPQLKGKYHLSDRPGIGVKPNPDFLQDCGQLWRQDCWKTH